MTDKEQGDPTQVGNLLDPVTGDIASVTADGADDGELVSRAVAERAPEAEVLIPARCIGKASAQADEAPTRRDRPICRPSPSGGASAGSGRPAMVAGL